MLGAALTKSLTKGALVALFCCLAPVVSGVSIGSSPALAASTGSSSENVAGPTVPLVIETAAGKSHTFDIERAITMEQRSRGLMHRETMAPDHGMLFDFGEARMVTMWMENTPLSLDMIFADENGRIVRIAERTEPFSQALVSSGEPVLYVLEINGGRARELGIAEGDRLAVEALEEVAQ